MAAVEACLDRHAVAGQRLVVAVSGGVDSVVLLDCLVRLVRLRGLSLEAFHINHGLSVNAASWESHCRRFCDDRAVPIKAMQVEVERGSRDGLEAAARRARHAVFATTDADWIVLGHHRDDQAETLLFNLLRGTGLRGAAAMAEVNGRLLRPLLDVARDDIRAHAVARRLAWIEDESNTDTRYSRNHLRHRTLRDLAQRFPGSPANLAAAARRFAEARDLLDDLAQLDLGTHADDFPLETKLLTALAEPRARNLLRYLLQKRHIGIASEERLREAVQQLTQAAPDRHPAIVFGAWRLCRRGAQVVVEPVQED
jgi:tRNA(Ile)-lysidine synthase